jgi:thiamine biosynthesis lipoprotein
MNRAARAITCLLALVTFLTMVGCEREPQALQLEGGAFGTRYQILLAGEGVDLTALADTIEDTLGHLDLAFSTWRPDSEISRINAAEADRELALSPDLQRVLEEARVVHELSDGALDVALLPLSTIWGFQGAAEPVIPSDDSVALALTYSGMKRLDFNAHGTGLRKRDARQGLDVSALAKGYAVDRLGELLEAAGADNFLVEFGGEVLAVGERPGGGPWRVVVESVGPDLPALVLALSGEAVATSGDYRNHLVIDGRRLGHVLDPATGRPSEAGVVAATVIADTARRADALATAFLVMDEAAAFGLADTLGVGLRRVTREERGLVSRENQAFLERLAPAP